VERGLETGVYNRRGVTVTLPFDGGDQERASRAVFLPAVDAEALRFDWPPNLRPALTHRRDL